MGTNVFVKSGKRRAGLPGIVVASLIILGLAVLVMAYGVYRRLYPNGFDLSRPFRPPTPPAPVVPTCPIDGLPASEDTLHRRPLAVLIENSPMARPQTGLTDACAVYEAITEGGITRFLAIFLHADPPVIGPVRSARPHFINLAREYDAALVHCGESYEALQILTTDPSIYNLDQMKYARPFWRDRTRRAPHNLYTAAEKVRAQLLKLGWEQNVPSTLPGFTGTAPMPADATNAGTAEINFGGAVRYRLRLTYDAERGGYLREMDGKPHVDRVSGQPIVAKNVLIQTVQAAPFAESKLHTYDVTVVGGGDGLFLRDGKQCPMRWSKYNDQAITRYTDAAGNPLPFQAGQTWIELVPEDGTVVINTPAASRRLDHAPR